MQDREIIEKFALHFGLEVQVFKDSEFIVDEALKLGATETICLTSKTREFILDFNFNAAGKCIGYNTEATDSFVERIK